MKHAELWFLDQALNLGLLQWKHGVLTTGLPGKSQGVLLYSGWEDLLEKETFENWRRRV